MQQTSDHDKPSINEIKTFVYEWNLKFPIDRWWRRKHGVPFGSAAHRACSLIDMLIEYQEDMEFKRLTEEAKLSRSSIYRRGVGDWLTPSQGMTVEEIDEAFDNLDISKIREKEKNNA